MTRPPDHRPRCSALTKAGDQCSRRAHTDGLCKVHAGTAKPQGRPTKLTPKLRDTLATHLRNGNYREQAAAAVGIAPATFYAWLERAQADDEAGKVTPYTEFMDAVTRAEAEAETTAVETIRRHFPLDWRAAAWYLERSKPARWRRRDSVEVEGELVTKTVEDVAPETEEQRRKVATILADSGVLEHELAELTTPKRKGPDR